MYGKAAGRACPAPTNCGKGGCRAACPQAAVPVCGNEKPCQNIVGGGVPDAPRSERRRKVCGRDESLPYGLPFSCSWPGGGGGVKTPPYDAKDKRAVPARWRAGHARPLRTSVPGQSFHPAERGTINRTQKRPKNRLVRHCGQNAHNSSKNMCNFLNKTPLRKGVFFGTIKLCKSVCLELCPEQDRGMCQMTQDLCGPDNRTAL